MVSTEDTAVSVRTDGRSEVLWRRETDQEEGKTPGLSLLLVEMVEEMVQLGLARGTWAW